MARNPGSLTSGEMDAVLLVGRSTPATKPGRGTRLVGAEGAKPGFGAVRRKGRRLVGGTEPPRDKARPLRRLRVPLAHGIARELGGRTIELARKRLHAVIGKRHRGGVEGIGLDDVGTRLPIMRMDIA